MWPSDVNHFEVWGTLDGKVVISYVHVRSSEFTPSESVPSIRPGHRISFEGKRTIAVERSVIIDSDDELVRVPAQKQINFTAGSIDFARRKPHVCL